VTEIPETSPLEFDRESSGPIFRLRIHLQWPSRHFHKRGAQFALPNGHQAKTRFALQTVSHLQEIQDEFDKWRSHDRRPR
jgi:hypothetical protein